MDFYTAKYTYKLDFTGKLSNKLCIYNQSRFVFIKCLNIILFPGMKQVNVTTGKERPIKRALNSATDFR